MTSPALPLSFPRRASALLAALMLALPLAVGAAEKAADKPVLSESLSVAGAVKTPLTLTVAQLEALPVEQVAQTDSHQADGKTVTTDVRGVRLTALLDRAALAGTGKNDWKHAVVVASATDGYSVAFSWPELFDTDVGPGVLVIFERDGQPLTDREGRIALVSAKDIHNGPRNVHWLSKIDVRILAP
jgi:DMSO/TMAO reductase YedYZ molybdopterin-dependent catalytic subunit